MQAKIKFIPIVLTYLLSSHFALAKPANLDNPTQTEANGDASKRCEREHGGEHKLELLNAALKLTAEQKSAWLTWSATFKGDKADWATKHETIESWRNLPAPERMENMLKLEKERLAKQENHLAATKVFYATLTAEQRQIFDQEFKFPHSGSFCKHRRK